MDGASDLVERLLTAAAVIMEDSAEEALTRGEPAEVLKRIRLVQRASEDIATLAAAATVVEQRWLHTRVTDSEH